MVDVAAIKEFIRTEHRAREADKKHHPDVCEYCHNRGVVYFATDHNDCVVHLTIPGGTGKNAISGWLIRPVVCSCQCDTAHNLRTRLDSSSYGFTTADEMRQKTGYTPMALVAGMRARASRLLGVDLNDLYDEVEVEDRAEKSEETEEEVPF